MFSGHARLNSLSSIDDGDTVPPIREPGPAPDNASMFVLNYINYVMSITELSWLASIFIKMPSFIEETIYS